MSRAGIWAVVPVKAFERGKSRLGPVLADPARASFARQLFTHVVSELRQADAIDTVLVISDDEDVREVARELSCQVVADPPHVRGLADVVDEGLSRAVERGAQSAFVCMADLPRLTRAEVDEACSELAHHDVVLVPDLVDEGTNVLALRDASAMRTCFGNADSFQRHQRRSGELDFKLAIRRPAGLCFDVDGPEDLDSLRPPPADSRPR